MPPHDSLDRLGPNAPRGSKPRCHFLTHGTKAEVAAELTKLVEPWGHVRPDCRWLPRGFECTDEAKLAESPGFLPPGIQEAVSRWWLAARRGANTPNWDLASTCRIQRRFGLMFVEAKAHVAELSAAGCLNRKAERPGEPPEDRPGALAAACVGGRGQV